MRKTFTYLFTLATLLLSGTSLWAQDMPSPKGKWTFEDVSELLKPAEGTLQLQAAALGNKSATLCETVAEAGITATDGPIAENKAILVPKDAALWVALNDENASNNYTIQMDFMVENALPYDGLFQTDPTNANDGDIFVYNNKIGIGSLGYGGTIANKKWYRLFMVNNGGTFSLYIDGELINSNDKNEARFQLAPEGFFLCCDEDGEANDTYVSEVAYWDTPLTAEQIAACGNIEQEAMGANLTKDENGFYLIGTAEDLITFADIVNAGDTKANAKLTADIDMGGKVEEGVPTQASPSFIPIGSSNIPFQGVFDGQDHIIKNLVITRSENYVGLFGRVTGTAVIKNLIIDGNSYISGASYVGIIGATINSASLSGGRCRPQVPASVFPRR